MKEISAKEMIKEYLCTKKSAVYFHNDSDFLTFQKAYAEIINANHLTKLVRCTARLEDILTYTDFKETILKRTILNNFYHRCIFNCYPSRSHR